ncbi:MAG TPA: ABC-F family ATP-binding cassette domain-containing protein, partial [Polyangiaceae bacterium]
MPILTARNLSKAFGARPLFTGATFTLRRGEKAALLGVNGTGKSTLLRVIAGLEPADGGSVEQRRDTTILYLPQEPELAPDRTARQIVQEGLAKWHAVKEEDDAVTERIGNDGHDDHDLLTRQASLGDSLEHLGGWSRDHEVDEMLGHLGIDDRDRPVGTMSGGERRRVALARLLVARPDLAILDEPTNHLDADTIAWLEEHLRDVFPGAVLIVTHDRYVLDAVATRIFELENGNLTEFTKRSDALGAYADFLEQRADRDAHEERTESNRQNLIRREVEWLRRGPKARSTKQKARIQRAEAVIGESGPQKRGQVELSGLEDGAKRLGGTILELRDLSIDLGGRRLVDHLTLSLVRGDRIGIVGPNGAGKTSLLRAVTGELTPTTGSAVRGAQTKISFFDQARTSLKEDWTVFDNVAEREGADRTGAGAVTIGDRTLELRAYLELFLFDGNALRRKVSALSGGERARVALALALKTGANVLLLD